jgi:L-arabinokinase
MGGSSAYHGGLCLGWPLQASTRCALQRTRDGQVEVRSSVAAREGWQTAIVIPTSFLLQLDFTTARDAWLCGADERWAKYILGAFLALRDSGRLQLSPQDGAKIYLDSDAPIGAGVGSSASLEVAAMLAISRAWEISLDGVELAQLCWRVENEIIGKHCSIMDQMAVALGRQNQLLRLLCQPAQLQGYEGLPEGVALFGINSHVRHPDGVTNAHRARCASYMGRRMLIDLVPEAMHGPDGEFYLANLGSDIWRSLREQIPEKQSGAEFLQRYDSHLDTLTTPDSETVYQVRLATEHPVYEADRTSRFAQLLRAARENPHAREALLRAAGELMIQSHFSYDHRCQLSSPETDVMIRLVREAGPRQGLYGAKVTAGGAGGTVAVLVDRQVNSDVESTLQSICDSYQAETGNRPQLLSGSSDGAVTSEIL